VLQTARGSKLSARPADLLKLLSLSKRYRKEAIIMLAKEAGIGRDDFRELISTLLDDGALFEHNTPRQGTRPVITYARFKPTNEEMVAA
jgi:hypothetical protein